MTAVEYIGKDEYYYSKEKEIASADEARNRRIAAAAMRLRELPAVHDYVRTPTVGEGDDEVAIESLMMPDDISGGVRTPDGVNRVKRDYDGHRGSGSPGNAKQIPGIVHH